MMQRQNDSHVDTLANQSNGEAENQEPLREGQYEKHWDGHVVSTRDLRLYAPREKLEEQLPEDFMVPRTPTWNHKMDFRGSAPTI